MVEVSGLIDPALLVEIEADAVVGRRAVIVAFEDLELDLAQVELRRSGAASARSSRRYSRCSPTSSSTATGWSPRKS
jgi:hypothetical protein